MQESYYDPVLEDEILVAAPLGPRVTTVLPLKDYVLALGFNNGESRLFDAKPLLKEAVFSRLKCVPYFNLVRVAYGTIAWPGDIDYCPDCLYAQSIPMDN
ncbi:MAG: DUF2442 domain-containing protein [Oscillospiraceae bacterium]|jgi:hypothetical protein|nr:DUF2442 domain-containing protein [Oscillospiraceae bacterium]